MKYNYKRIVSYATFLGNYNGEALVPALTFLVFFAKKFYRQIKSQGNL